MPVNCTHSDYDANLPAWLRARDVLAGEDAVKAAGERYLPRLESQSSDEYQAYKARASFFNATARTLDGFVGLIFRREPTVQLPERVSGVAGDRSTQKCRRVQKWCRNVFPVCGWIVFSVTARGWAASFG